MSSARTRCARIEERTLRIGFGIKRTSQREVGLPELLALQPALCGREATPLGPFVAHQVFRLDSKKTHHFPAACKSHDLRAVYAVNRHRSDALHLG